MDTTNCNAQQADTIIALRPFAHADDVEDKLGSKAAKGVTPRLFHQCKDLMAGYYEVDEVLVGFVRRDQHDHAGLGSAR